MENNLEKEIADAILQIAKNQNEMLKNLSNMVESMQSMAVMQKEILEGIAYQTGKSLNK